MVPMYIQITHRQGIFVCSKYIDSCSTYKIAQSSVNPPPQTFNYHTYLQNGNLLNSCHCWPLARTDIWRILRNPILPGSTSSPWPLSHKSPRTNTLLTQTFVGGIIAYKALPRPMFSQLQQRVFPVYFTLQSIFPALVLVTHPTASITSLLTPSSPYFYSTTAPLLLAIAVSTLNLTVIGPATTRVMRKRKAQEAKEGKKYYDEGPKSEAMKKLNSKFGRIHGISSLLGLVGFLSAAAYGVVLGSSLSL